MNTDPAYEKFGEEMAQLCECHAPYDRPCAGVLAGGLCDRMGEDRELASDEEENKQDEDYA